MIEEVNGTKRAGKSLLTAFLASTKGDKIKCYSNMTLNLMPFQVIRMDTRSVLDQMWRGFNEGHENILYVIDEAHRRLNARMWKEWSTDDTFNMTGIYMDDKLDSDIIYTCFQTPDNSVLAVDKMFRDSCEKRYSIKTDRDFIRNNDFIIYQVDYPLSRYMPSHDDVLVNASFYFNMIETKEVVI